MSPSKTQTQWNAPGFTEEICGEQKFKYSRKSKKVKNDGVKKKKIEKYKRGQKIKKSPTQKEFYHLPGTAVSFSFS